jgi:ribosomal protein L25 (general stress protein Ctc)
LGLNLKKPFMKLYPLSISQLLYLETGQFIIRFLTDFDSLDLNPATDSEFKTLYDSLQTQSPIYDLALMQIKAKAESELLMAQDSVRDKKVITLRRALSVFEHSDIEAEIAAYKLVKIILNTYKDIEKANFEAESLGVDNLIVALRNESHLPAVRTLGLEKHIDNLEVANNTFKSTFNTRSTATIITTVYDTKLLRKNIMATYKELAEYVYVMAKRKETPFYIDTLAAINNGRKYFADILARRSGNNDENTLPTT